MNKIQTVREITAILAVLGITYKDFLMSIAEDEGITYINATLNGKASQVTVYQAIGKIMELLPVCNADTLITDKTTVTHVLETRNITVTIVVEFLGL